MAQVRFNIGVPRGGSAARIAEDSAGMPAASLRPRAGSAARDAEDRKRAEGMPMQRAASLSLRADGGRKFEKAVPGPEPTGKEADADQKLLMGRLQTGSNLPAAVAATSFSPTGGAAQPAGALRNETPGPLHTAGERIKSLVQSLFSPGTSKP